MERAPISCTLCATPGAAGAGADAKACGENRPMRLTQRTEYALRALIELAERQAASPAPATIAELAQAQGLPERFLGQALRDLAHAGLLRLQRGNGGGVWLARSPADISVLEVIEAVEGRVSLAGCMDQPPSCPLTGRCRLERVLGEAQAAMKRVLRKATLADLVRVAPPGTGPPAL
ncbi:MAG: Rrf2 family transcriptional regulator [Chloroflexota bacterium]